MLFGIIAQVCIGCIPPPPPPPPPVINNCFDATIDVTAVGVLSNLPRVGFEYGMSFDCVQVNNAITPRTVNFRHSFSTGNTNDPCSVSLLPTANTAAFGHTHPYFSNSTEYIRGNGCFGDKTRPSSSALSTLNRNNRNFSSNDTAAARQRNKPFYLGTPTRSNVKVYRKVNGSWRTITLV